MNKLTMETVRAIVRPLLTLSGWVVVCYLAISEVSVREFFLGLIATMIGFWFGQRGKEK